MLSTAPALPRCGIAIAISLLFAGCAQVALVTDGRASTTPLPDGLVDVYVTHGLMQTADRSALLQKWDATATAGCSGKKYTLVGEQSTGQATGGPMFIQGKVRCSR